ncbi:MAG: DUF3857 domain-containing protein [Candidatus Zixiibacteriota bacterium]
MKNYPFLVILAVFCLAQTPTAQDNQSDPIIAIDQLSMSGKYGEVIAESRRVLESDSTRIDILNMEVGAGIRSDNAEDYVEAALSDTGTSLIPAFRRALVQKGVGLARDALTGFERLHEDYPDLGWTTYWLGCARMNMGQDSAALEMLKEAVAYPWVRHSAERSMASLYRSLGMLDVADSLYRLVAEDAYLWPSTQFDLVSNVALRGDWQGAFEQAAALVERYPNADMYDSYSGLLNRAGRYDESYRVLSEALSLWPDNKDLQEDMAWTCVWVGHQNEAIEYVSAFSPLQRGYFTTMSPFYRAVELNDTLMIQQCGREVTSYGYWDDYPYQRYISWLYERGRRVEADSILAYLAEHASPLVEARALAARNEDEVPEEAIRIFDSLAPNYARYDGYTRDLIGWLYDAGREKEADELVQRYLEHMPGNLFLPQDLAYRADRLHDDSTAFYWLHRIDSIAPGSVRAISLRAWIALDNDEREVAARLIDSLAKRQPAVTNVLRMYESFYSGEEYEDSLLLVADRYRQQTRHSDRMLMEVAAAYMYARRYETADSILTEAIQANPNSAELYYRRGRVSTNAGEVEKAQRDYERANALDPFTERYSRGLVHATIKSQTLDLFADQTKLDSTRLTLLPVDSVRSLAAAATTEPGEGGGVVVLEHFQKVYHDDFTKLRRYHRIVKIVSVEGKQQYGSGYLTFNAWNETPRLILARSILPDGEVIEVKPDQTYITSVSSNSDSRALSFKYPALDTGVIVEMVVQFEGWSSDLHDVYYWYSPGEVDPVDKSELELVVPRSWPIHYETSEGVITDKTDSSGTTVYRWHSEHIAPNVYESDSPSTFETGEWVQFGYYRSWKEEADWYWNKIASKMTADRTITELAHDLTEAAGTEEEKIAALFNFVAKNIRYVAIEFGEGTIIPRPAYQVLENKYGDCKDKSILLISLLSAEGIAAYPMLVTSWDTAAFARDIPETSHFNHMVVYRPVRGGQVLDPTCSVCRPGDLSMDYRDKPALVVGSDLVDPLVWTSPATPADNVLRRLVRVTGQKGGGAAVDIDMEFDGETGMYLKSVLQSADTSKLHDFIEEQSMVGIWTGTEIKDWELLDTAGPGLTYHWRATGSIDSVFMADFGTQELPLNFYLLGAMMSAPDTVDRKQDFMLGGPCRVEDEFRFIPGDRWKLDNARLSWKIDTTWFVATCNESNWDDSMSVKMTLETRQDRVDVNDVTEFVRALDFVEKRCEAQGPVYRYCGDPERIKTLEDAIDAHPEDISLKVTLSQLLLGEDYGGSGCKGVERRRKAADLMSQSLKIDPDNEMLLVGLGGLFVMDDKYRDADSVVADYFSRHNGSTSLLSYLKAAVAVGLGNSEQARDGLEKLLVQMPDDEMRWLLVGVYMELEEYDKAEYQIQLLKDLKADSITVARMEYEYYLGREDYDRVEELIEQWPDTNKYELLDLKTRLYSKRGEFLKAARESYRFLRDEPDASVFLNNCAWYSALADTNLSEALTMANDALHLEGGCDHGLLNTRGLVYYKLGRTDDARRDFEAALGDETAHSQTLNYYYLGQCALQEKNEQQAIEYFERAISIGGDKHYVKLATESLEELGVDFSTRSAGTHTD